MTVPTRVAEEVFLGNGVQREFPTQIHAVADADIQVFVRTNAGDRALVLGADFTVTGLEGNVTVNTTAAPANGNTLVVVRTVDYLQDTSIVNEGGFFPEVLELAYDKIVMMIQQLFALNRRSFRTPPGETLNTLPSAGERANKFLAFDADGHPEAAIGAGSGDPLSLENYPTKANIQEQELTYFAVDQSDPNLLVLLPNPAWINYAEGLKVSFKAAATSTGAVSANVSGRGPVEVHLAGIRANANDIVLGRIYSLVSDGAALQLEGAQAATDLGGHALRDLSNVTALDVAAQTTLLGKIGAVAVATFANLSNTVTTLAGTIPAKATNTDVDQEADDTKFITVVKVYRAIARRVKNATMVVRGTVLLARNADADASSNFDTTRATTVAIVRRIVGNMTSSIAAGLNGLVGAARVSFNALKDVPAAEDLIQDVGSGNFNLTINSRFATESNSADITVPMDSDWGLVTIEGLSNGQEDVAYIINLARLRAFEADYGESADAIPPGRNALDLGKPKPSSGFGLLLSSTVNNKLLVAGDGAVDARIDPMPLTLKKISNSIRAAAGSGSLTPEQLARLLPNLPAAGHRDGRVPRFDGEVLSWQEEAGITDAERARLLPELPAEGSRAGKILAFAGDALTWAAGFVQRVVLDQAPSADTRNKINFHEDQAEVTEEYIEHEGAPQTATFAALNDPDFEGVEVVPAGGRVEDRFSEDDWIFNPTDHRPYVVVDRDPLTPGVQKLWRQATFGEVLANFSDYVGEYANDADAGSHVTTIRSGGRTGSLYFDTTLEELKETTSITAGTGRVVGLIFRRLLTSQDYHNLDIRIKSATDDAAEHSTQLASLRAGLAGEGTDRAAGDIITAQSIASASEYQTALNAQLGGNNALLLHITADIAGTRGGANYTWSAGQVLYITKASDTVRPWFLIPEASSGSSSGSGPSAAKATTAQVDAVRAQGNQIDLAGIGATSRNLLDDTRYMTVRLVTRLLDRVLKIATTSTAGIVALARNNEYDDLNQANNTRAMTVYGFRRMLGSTLDSKADQTDLDAEVTARTDADTALGTRVDNLARGFSIDPDYFLREVITIQEATNNEKPRTFVLHVHPDDFPAGATHLEFLIQGLAPAARAELVANQTAYDFTFTTARIRTILQNPGTVARVDVRYYDAANGGTQLGHIIDGLRVVDEIPSGFTPTKANLYDAVKEVFHPATNSVSADDANNELDITVGVVREHVVLAEARITVASGQDALVFPADYATYENYEIVVGANGNIISVLRGKTSILALAEDADALTVGVHDVDEAGSQQWLTWTPSTRTWGHGFQNSNDSNIKFKAARLYDEVPTAIAAPNILQEAVDGGDAAGVAQLELPANFANWRYLHLSIWEGAGDIIVPMRLSTAVIAAQSANRQFAFQGAQSAHQLEVTYSAGRRRFIFDDATDRIIYAALEN